MKRTVTNRPLVFAHRGAKRVAPENTLPAFEAAIRLGADGVELDVQYSSDGKLVIFHDFNLEKTSNGTGRVVSHTFDDLRKLDAGSHFSPEFAGTQIPTLDEVLDLAQGQAARQHRAEVARHLQGTTGRRRRCRRPQRTRWSTKSSSARSIPSSSAAPRRPGRRSSTPSCWTSKRPPGPVGASPLVTPAPTVCTPRRRWSTPPTCPPPARRKMPVRVWTVNAEDDMRRLAGLGVDAIITDTPDVGLRVIQGSAA